jgi:hypothetical protein
MIVALLGYLQGTMLPLSARPCMLVSFAEWDYRSCDDPTLVQLEGGS